MGGNWIAHSDGERGRATHYSPIGFWESVAWKAIFKHCMPRVCSLIHVESTSPSRSHPLQHFLQAGWWLLNELRSGPLWWNDQLGLHLEIQRAVTGERRKNNSSGMWKKINCSILIGREEKCIGTVVWCVQIECRGMVSTQLHTQPWSITFQDNTHDFLTKWYSSGLVSTTRFGTGNFDMVIYHCSVSMTP